MKFLKTKCEECGKSFDTLKGVLLHLKAHKMKPAEYIHKYYPRYDLHTGKIITYKDSKDYFSRDFNSKQSEYSFLCGAKGYEGDAKRIIDKQMKEAVDSIGRFPSFCEWRGRKGVDYERLPWFEQLYKKWFKDGFKCFGDIDVKSGNDLNILVDTREQKPLFNTEKTTVNVGDYTLSG